MIRKFLDLNFGHLLETSRAWLDDNCTGHAYDFGLFIFVPSENPEDCPPDVAGIFAFARTNQCEYFMLDIDGPVLAELPYHSEKG